MLLERIMHCGFTLEDRTAALRHSRLESRQSWKDMEKPPFAGPDREMGMSWKEEIKFAIKDELMGRFRNTDAKAGDILSPEWLYNEYLTTLSPKEEKILEEAVNEMIHEGLLEYVGGRKPSYRLTRKGEMSLC